MTWRQLPPSELQSAVWQRAALISEPSHLVKGTICILRVTIQWWIELSPARMPRPLCWCINFIFGHQKIHKANLLYMLIPKALLWQFNLIKPYHANFGTPRLWLFVVTFVFFLMSSLVISFLLPPSVSRVSSHFLECKRWNFFPSLLSSLFACIPVLYFLEFWSLCLTRVII